MKKKALALAVAGAFFAPASYAAQDTSGMQYTSASEGFYASIRARFATESTKNKGAGIENSSSRFGVRGTNDLGGGLKGFYQYEAGVGIDNGSGLSTRVGQVGLEGSFGRVWAGSGWTETYNMVYGSTDIGNSGAGSLAYSAVGGMRPGRASNMIQYRTPDLSGFQAALGVNLKANSDNQDGFAVENARAVRTANVGGTGAADAQAILDAAAKDSTNVDMWSLAAKYSVQGFTGAFSYSVKPDSNSATYLTNAELGEVLEEMRTQANYNRNTNIPVVAKKDDYTAWTARLGYAQDNWYVNGWYGRNNDGDFTVDYTVTGGANDGDVVTYGTDDSRFVSLAGGVAVGKVNLYAVWEKVERGVDGSIEDANTVIGVQYNLGSRSRVWMNYIGQDKDTSTTEEDFVHVGLRHDF